MGKKRGFDHFFNLGKGDDGYIAIPYKLFDSKIWNGLSKTTQLAYLCILRNYNGRNAHNIICPREQLKVKISSRGWLLATKQLEDSGLITVIRRSGINKAPNIYALSNKWKSKERELYNKLKALVITNVCTE